MPDYTILIADYDPKTTEFATEVFAGAGFAVQVAKDGLKAVEAFKKHRPLLTLIEFMMPRKAGLEVCRDLRHSPEGRDAHLVVMSSPFRGRAFRADAVRVYGATETVEKPLNAEKLEGLIERLVRPRLVELLAVAAPAESAPAGATVACPVPDEVTAQALHDVVSAVLGPQPSIEPGAAGPVGPPLAAPSHGTAATPAAQGTANRAASRPSVAEENAGEEEIEDLIDSLFDF